MGPVRSRSTGSKPPSPGERSSCSKRPGDVTATDAVAAGAAADVTLGCPDRTAAGSTFLSRRCPVDLSAARCGRAASTGTGTPVAASIARRSRWRARNVVAGGNRKRPSSPARASRFRACGRRGSASCEHVVRMPSSPEQSRSLNAGASKMDADLRQSVGEVVSPHVTDDLRRSGSRPSSWRTKWGAACVNHLHPATTGLSHTERRDRMPSNCGSRHALSASTSVR